MSVLINDLYYGHTCECCGGFENAARQSVVFSPEALAKGLEAIYKGLNVRDEIEDHIFRETLRLFNEAASKGISESKWPDVPDEFINQLRTNNAIWSAFRVHRMQNDIASKLIDENGQLKKFDRWVEDIKGMTNHYVGPWLRTEYNTAVIRAHQAADWKHFEAEADVFQNVRWMPTTSPDQDPLHRQYWEKKLTLPINHPFWEKHRPGDRWNCKCTLQQTDEPVNDEVIRDFYPVPQQPGLDNNPADDGKLFSDSHPYIDKAYAGAQAAVEAKVMPKKRQKTDEEKRILRERWEERRLYRENMAEVAKIMKMKVPTKHMDFDTANERRGNPKYLTGRSYQINCQSCVVANEMRRRGLTVSARPNTKKWDSVPYRLSYQTELIWIDPKTGQLPQLQEIYAMTETAAAVDWARRTAEPGRYHLRFHWKSRGGHIITFERKEDGTGLFYDPQTGGKYQEDQFYYDRIKIDSLRFYRVDNLRVDTSMISGAVVKQKE